MFLDDAAVKAALESITEKLTQAQQLVAQAQADHGALVDTITKAAAAQPTVAQIKQLINQLPG